ncbi:MAG: PilN domain-containing protein, partial [Actinobacteria bacterium]|nr:PilN domain-containing protein [Actinomycetota bacterium]
DIILNVILILLIIVFIILIAGSVFLFDINRYLEPRLSDYENINMKINNYITKLEAYEQFKNKVNAKSGLINLLQKDEISWSEILYDFGEKIPDNVYIDSIVGDSVPFYGFLAKSPQEKQETGKILCFSINGYAVKPIDIIKLMIEIGDIPNIGEVWVDNISKSQVAGFDASSFTISAFYDLEPYLEKAAPAKKEVPEEEDLLDTELESMSQ